MEHLDADLAFPSSEMESLDFSGEEGGVSSSCLLQILPPEASYTQAGLDLHEYAAALSPALGLGALEETTLSTDNSVSVPENFESADSLPMNNVSPTSNKDITDSRHLLDETLFARIQNTEVEPSCVDVENSASPASDTPSTSYLLTSQNQQQGASIGKPPVACTVPNDSPHKFYTGGIVTDKGCLPTTTQSVRLPSFSYLSGGIGSLSSVAPNVCITSSSQKARVNNFPSRKFRKSKEKKSVKRLSTQKTSDNAAAHETLSTQTVGLPPSDACQIQVELTQVSNDTTIIKLSFVPDGTKLDSGSQNVILNQEILASLLNDKGVQNGNVESKEATMLESNSFDQQPEMLQDTIAGNGDVSTSEPKVTTGNSDDEDDDKSLLKVKQELALKEEWTCANSEPPASDERVMDNSACTHCEQPDAAASTEEQSVTEHLSAGSRVAAADEVSARTSETVRQEHRVNWNSMEEMTLENAEAEMASMLAESKLRMKTLAKLDEITIHITDSQCRLVNGKKRWCCELCDKSYTTKNNLVVHTLGHNGIKPHVCMLCQRMFSQQSHLKTHMLTHGNIKPHACKVCNRTFTQLSHVKRHMSTHMDTCPYRCDTCQRGFAYPSELKSHNEKHTRAKHHKCSQCEASFDQPKKLQFHERTLHKKPDELTCKECGKQYMYPSQLREHRIKHSGKRPYVCNQCGMDFMKEHHLKAHMFTHSGVKPWECLLCRRTFNQKANMLRHMLIHSVEKNFECEICHKHFSQLQTLKAHKIVHSKKKPFHCKLCGKQFGRLHTLQGHMHIHEDSKPHVCFCGANFTLRGNLTRHQKVKHGIMNSAHSTEEEAANILKAMSTKRAAGPQDKSSADKKGTLARINLTTSAKTPAVMVRNERVHAAAVETSTPSSASEQGGTERVHAAAVETSNPSSMSEQTKNEHVHTAAVETNMPTSMSEQTKKEVVHTAAVELRMPSTVSEQAGTERVHTAAVETNTPSSASKQAWTAQDAASTAPLVANFHTYSAKSKPPSLETANECN